MTTSVSPEKLYERAKKAHKRKGILLRVIIVLLAILVGSGMFALSRQERVERTIVIEGELARGEEWEFWRVENYTREEIVIQAIDRLNCDFALDVSINGETTGHPFEGNNYTDKEPPTVVINPDFNSRVVLASGAHGRWGDACYPVSYRVETNNGAPLNVIMRGNPVRENWGLASGIFAGTFIIGIGFDTLKEWHKRKEPELRDFQLRGTR